MRVLVTGSAGFIGFHVASALLSQGHDVVGLDNFNDYYPRQLKDAREALLSEHERYTSIEQDIVVRDATVELVRTGGFDAVCNLAAQAGVRHSITHPFTYVDTNISGFLNILEGCRHAPRMPRLVYASSSSVYGGLTELPFTETMRVDTPISLYAASKKANELMAHTYSHLFELQTIGLRFFTVYGPWGRPDMMMWIFAEAIREGRPIKVFNNGDMTRSFSYIDDIVQGVLAAIISPSLPACEVLNLGNDHCDNLMDVVAVLEEGLGRKAVIDYQPIQAGDVPATWADISLARQHLDLRPESTPMKAGVLRFVEWLQAHPDLAATVESWRAKVQSAS